MNNQMDNMKMPNQRPGQNQPEQIDLIEIFYIMLEHFWQILFSLVLGGVIAFMLTYHFVTPMYTASARIYMVSSSSSSVINLIDSQLGAQLSEDYRDLLLSRTLLNTVIDNLSLNMNYRQLASMISITNKSSTRILDISVTGPDPVQAAEIVNELSKQSIDYLPKIMECKTPNMIEDAEVPTGKVSPSYSNNTMKGALLMCALYCGFILVRYLMNDTFNTPDDVERYFGVRPLASIPEGNLGGFDSKKKKGNRYFNMIMRNRYLNMIMGKNRR